MIDNSPNTAGAAAFGTKACWNPRSRGRNKPANGTDQAAQAEDDAGFDAGILPPSIARESPLVRPLKMSA